MEKIDDGKGDDDLPMDRGDRSGCCINYHSGRNSRERGRGGKRVRSEENGRCREGGGRAFGMEGEV